MPRKPKTSYLRAQLETLRAMDVAQAAFDDQGRLKAVMFHAPRPQPAREQPAPVSRPQMPDALRAAGFDDQHFADLTAHLEFS